MSNEKMGIREQLAEIIKQQREEDARQDLLNEFDGLDGLRGAHWEGKNVLVVYIDGHAAEEVRVEWLEGIEQRAAAMGISLSVQRTPW